MIEDEQSKEKTVPKHHMKISWFDTIKNASNQVTEASLEEKSLIIGRIGIMLLSCGTGAWRVREAMNAMARMLNLTCSADIGLVSISFTCFDRDQICTQVLKIAQSGVNTSKLDDIERFVRNFADSSSKMNLTEIHLKLDQIEKKNCSYSINILSLAAGLACSSFIFLLGGGIIEMICCFVGATIGNWIRNQLINRGLTLIVTIALGVATACLTYLLVVLGLEKLFHLPPTHEAGYIGSMLFVIPGFPFITSMLDFSKQDFRSGIERLFYSLMITTVATIVGWLVAYSVHLQPTNFSPLHVTPLLHMVFRFIASFCGVFGFSIMFNSPYRIASLTGLIGAFANTLRLELIDFTKIPPAAIAFFASLTAGILASLMNRFDGYPRISLTVPATVIMIPGLYIYRGMYKFGSNNISEGAFWFSKAILIIILIPLGLFMARVIMDRSWRCGE